MTEQLNLKLATRALIAFYLARARRPRRGGARRLLVV
eukprot:COSAG02_NODE_4731_length_5043_cov_3.579895_8_plen_37_part_00